MSCCLKMVGHSYGRFSDRWRQTTTRLIRMGFISKEHCWSLGSMNSSLGKMVRVACSLGKMGSTVKMLGRVVVNKKWRLTDIFQSLPRKKISNFVQFCKNIIASLNTFFSNFSVQCAISYVHYMLRKELISLVVLFAKKNLEIGFI